MGDFESQAVKTGEEKKRIPAGDFVIGVILTAFGIYVIVAALNMRVFQTILDAPGLFPFILGLILTLLGVLLLYSAFKLGALKQLKEMTAAGYRKEMVSRFAFQRVVVMTLLMIAYIFLLIGRLHFIAATFVYLAVTFFYLKASGKVMVLVIAALTALIIGYSFRVFFGIPLP